MKATRNINFTLFTFYLLLSIVLVNLKKPALAFIPTVYEPNFKELKSKGKGLGEIAAQLLYFGEVKKADQVASLAVKLNPNEDELWGILAEAQMRSKKLNSARSSLNKAQALKTKKAIYYFK